MNQAEVIRTYREVGFDYMTDAQILRHNASFTEPANIMSNPFQEAFNSAIDWGTIIPDESATSQLPVSNKTRDSGGFWGFAEDLTDFAGNIADVVARFENQSTSQPQSQPQQQNGYLPAAQAGIIPGDLGKWAVFGVAALIGVYLIKELKS